MSTLVAQTISNGTVSTSSANVIQGSAKAWVNFSSNGGATAVRTSFNVSSVTYVSTGRYSINMTNALADANYAVNATCSSENNGFTAVMSVNNYSGTSVTPTTIAFTVFMAVSGANSLTNNNSSSGGVYVAVFR